MKLSYESIQNRTAWEQAGVTLPKFDWKDMAAETEAHPTWVHFGSGSLFRAFHAMLQQSLIEQGLVKVGLYTAETFDYEIVDNTYGPYDNLSLLVTLMPDGNMEKLVIEDRFPNGRPPLEKAGVFMADRDTVNNVERMKVMTCPNPLHTALAVYGCLLGYDSIAAELRDPELKGLIEKIGYVEGMPVMTDPGIIKPMDFIHEVIDQRFPNPFTPDTPQRIASDTSQKISIRFGKTIKAYAERTGMDLQTLTFIPLAIAGWLCYLLAVDDEGKPFTCSGDPMLEELQGKLSGVTLGKPDSVDGKLEDILRNPVIFGSDLVELGLAGKIEGMVKELLAGPGAVRSTLKKYLAAD